MNILRWLSAWRRRSRKETVLSRSEQLDNALTESANEWYFHYSRYRQALIKRDLWEDGCFSSHYECDGAVFSYRRAEMARISRKIDALEKAIKEENDV